MKKIIIGNWKMNGDAAMAHPLVEAVAATAAALPDVTVIVCPPATLLTQVVSWLVGSKVKAGGQDCSSRAQGAYTGEVSAAMLHEAGSEYVIVGHSERRQHHRETNEEVSRKATQAMKAGLVPVICIGETKAQRDSGKAEDIAFKQVKECLPAEAATGHFILAYEPVWAIGSGKTPTVDDIWRMHAHIISVASRETGLAPGRISVLYGGSVNAANAGEIMATEHVAGVLVGGASLKAEEFCKIIKTVAPSNDGVRLNK